MSQGVAQGIAQLEPRMVARFWSKVDRSGDCWIWAGGYFNSGYGAFYLWTGDRTRAHRAHRVAYTIAFDPLPDGWLVDHMCHNRACVKPDHLRPVTSRQNNENRQGAQAASKAGIRGVIWVKDRNKWKVTVTSGGKVHWGGYFFDKEEAGEAARLLRNKVHTHNDLDRK